jgi:hypothetical protein
MSKPPTYKSNWSPSSLFLMLQSISPCRPPISTSMSFSASSHLQISHPLLPSPPWDSHTSLSEVTKRKPSSDKLNCLCLRPLLVFFSIVFPHLNMDWWATVCSQQGTKCFLLHLAHGMHLKAKYALTTRHVQSPRAGTLSLDSRKRILLKENKDPPILSTFLRQYYHLLHPTPARFPTLSILQTYWFVGVQPVEDWWKSITMHRRDAGLGTSEKLTPHPRTRATSSGRFRTHF